MPQPPPHMILQPHHPSHHHQMVPQHIAAWFVNCFNLLIICTFHKPQYIAFQQRAASVHADRSTTGSHGCQATSGSVAERDDAAGAAPPTFAVGRVCVHSPTSSASPDGATAATPSRSATAAVHSAATQHELLVATLLFGNLKFSVLFKRKPNQS